MEYFETDQKGTPIAVRIPLDWGSSGPLPSTSGLFSTCFKAVSEIDNHFNLAHQIRSWYDMESFGAYKQVHPRFASDARVQKILEGTTHHDGCRYWVGMLCADKKNSLPKNYFSVQLLSQERLLVQNAEQKTS